MYVKFSRCLHSSAGYLVHAPLKASKIILACCVLHNIANREGDVIQVSENTYKSYY